MRHFPVFLDLAGRRALVVGDGETASRKADALREAGATVVATPRFDPAQLDGIAIAIGADAPEAMLAALSAAAQARGIPVNIVDRPALCSFITPAVVDRDPVTIAVSSGGAAPVLARLLRARIEALIPPAIGRVAAFADRFRAELRRRIPALGPRRAVLEAALGGPVAELVLAGDETAADAAMSAAIDAAASTATSPPGIVHLVGAGPGAGDLLTLRAQRLLGEADVVVHDRLVGDEALALARRDAARVFVGKRRADHCLPQAEINALLIRLAREGKRVVRLKGGDPFVFGRGGEEAAALAAAGIPFTIVPGVTAALACAAQAGIPLTHRDASRSLTLITGHTKDGTFDVDFKAIAHLNGTLAVYMGSRTLPRLRAGLIAHGMPPSMPVAVIERGGTPAQRTLHSTLAHIAAETAGWFTDGPALLLIGEAVALARPAARLAA